MLAVSSWQLVRAGADAEDQTLERWNHALTKAFYGIKRWVCSPSNDLTCLPCWSPSAEAGLAAVRACVRACMRALVPRTWLLLLLLLGNFILLYCLVWIKTWAASFKDNPTCSAGGLIMVHPSYLWLFLWSLEGKPCFSLNLENSRSKEPHFWTQEGCLSEVFLAFAPHWCSCGQENMNSISMH